MPRTVNTKRERLKRGFFAPANRPLSRQPAVEGCFKVHLPLQTILPITSPAALPPDAFIWMLHRSNLIRRKEVLVAAYPDYNAPEKPDPGMLLYQDLGGKIAGALAKTGSWTKFCSSNTLLSCASRVNPSFLTLH